MILLDQKLYEHRLFYLLIYANGCESKLIPLQIKLLEIIKKKGSLTRAKTITLIKRHYVGGQQKKVTEEGWLSRLFNIISPLKQLGLLTSTRNTKGIFAYTLSDGWVLSSRRDHILRPKDWFKESKSG